MIVFIDLETAGLDPRTGSILELAAVALDDDLNEVGSFESVVRPLHNSLAMDPIVVKMHTDNGLFHDLIGRDLNAAGPPLGSQLLDGVAPRRHEVEQATLRWLDAISPPDVASKKPPLGGSSIHFDREWLKEHMPDLERRFSYRNIDVSTIYECALRWAPALTRVGRDPEAPNNKHRAMPDVRFSIDRLRVYRRELFDTWQVVEAGKDPRIWARLP